MAENDRIAEMFQDSTIFITGGSGFLGLALIEKLLRACTDLKRIYILLRSKKGQLPQERLQNLINNPLFDKLRNENPQVLDKCQVIPGDVTLPNLGITPEHHQRLCNEVDFIYHGAATVRFDETVKYALQMNTRGTKFMLTLAKECKNLKLFTHISTAYAFPNVEILEEKPYDPPANPEEILAMIDFDQEGTTAEIESLLGNFPNSYAFSKSLGEGLVVKAMATMPAMIARPSIVCPMMGEHFPGWFLNLQGLSGLLVAGGKGLFRTMHGDPQAYADIIPVDYVINYILLASWCRVTVKPNLKVVNVCLSKVFTWKTFLDCAVHVATYHVPFNMVIWRPGGGLNHSKLVHNFVYYMFQMLPAIVIDVLLKILGYEPVLYKVQKRIKSANEMFEHYVMRNWNFCNDNARMIRDNLLNDDEKSIYNYNFEEFELVQYLSRGILTIRRYKFGDTDDTLPRARRNMYCICLLDVACKTLLALAMIYYAYKWIFLPILGGTQLESPIN